MPSLNQERIAGVLSDRGAAIIRCAEQGLSAATICTRFGLHHSKVRELISKEQQRRHEAGLKLLPETLTGARRSRVEVFPFPSSNPDIKLLKDSTLHALDDLQLETGTPAPERSSLPRRWWQVELDGKPAIGNPSLPGYAAWELVHGAGMSVRDATKRLGLRYPSEVYELLEKHKRGLQHLDEKQAIKNKDRTGIAF